MMDGHAARTRLADTTTWAASTVWLAAPTFLAALPSPPADTLDPTAIISGLTWQFWSTIGLALAFGAAGGLVYELINLRGDIEWPHRSRQNEDTTAPPYATWNQMFDLGILARLIVGALAALAITLFVSPATAFKLVATAVLAGSGGSTVFGALQDRLVAQVKQQQNDRLMKGVGLLTNALDEIVADHTAAGVAVAPGLLARLHHAQALARTLNSTGNPES
jgi:hypothetical protein